MTISKMTEGKTESWHDRIIRCGKGLRKHKNEIQRSGKALACCKRRRSARVLAGCNGRTLKRRSLAPMGLKPLECWILQPARTRALRHFSSSLLSYFCKESLVKSKSNGGLRVYRVLKSCRLMGLNVSRSLPVQKPAGHAYAGIFSLDLDSYSEKNYGYH